MKRTYLIDSENINDVWVELLPCLGDKDEILVFYTDKSAHMGYDRIVRLIEQKKGIIRWIKCFEGQNALDFQLVTELGSRISQDSKREYVIVSNDTGYDAVVRYWTLKECKVSRMKGVDCGHVAYEEEVEILVPAGEEGIGSYPVMGAGQENERKSRKRNGRQSVQIGMLHAVEPELEEEPPQSGNKPAGMDMPDVPEEPEGMEAADLSKTPADDSMQGLWDVMKACGSAEVQRDYGFLVQLCRLVKVSDLSLLHNVLEYHFGQELGNGIYRYVKDHSDCRSGLSTGYINNKKQREKLYLELIMKRTHLDENAEDVAGIMKILNAVPRKNLNSIHTALVRKFGQEQGGSYYAVLRNHVKIIRGL